MCRTPDSRASTSARGVLRFRVYAAVLLCVLCIMCGLLFLLVLLLVSVLRVRVSGVQSEGLESQDRGFSSLSGALPAPDFRGAPSKNLFEVKVCFGALSDKPAINIDLDEALRKLKGPGGWALSSSSTF